MRKLLLSCLGRLGFFLLFLNTAFAGNLTADLQTVLQNASPDQDIDIIIRFDGGIDIDRIISLTPDNRHTILINALQQASAIAQLAVNRFLARSDISNRVSNITVLWVINGLALTAKADVIPRLLNLNNVRTIQLDARIQANEAAPAAAATPEWNLDAVNAPDLWQLGFTGQGTVIAIVDTGADVEHPDLQPSWRGGSNSWLNTHDPQSTTPTDNITGHGTQVLGIIVGDSEGGTAIGVAPDAQWIAVKIFDNNGEAPLSNIHLGLQWLLDPDDDPNTDDAPDVVNNSWGFTNLLDICNDEFRDDIAALKAAEIALVFSAGNSGPDANTSLSPANELDSVAVGAVDEFLVIDSNSSRGPSACGGGLFPQFVAPGVNIRTSDLTFGGIFPDSYINVSGTSFAVSHVSGTIALLRSAFDTVSVSDLETVLTDTALDLGVAGPDNDYGVGLINALAAYNELTTLLQSPEGTLQLSETSYSVNETDASITIEVTRENGSDGEVTVEYRTIDDVASSASDFTATSGTLTFADGVTSQSFTVTVNNDSDIEGDEDFYVQLANASGGANLSSPAAAPVTVIDSEPPQPGDLQLSAASYSVNEASASVTIEVARTNGSDGTVSVDYATQDDSATDGSDYDQNTGTLTFDSGVVSQTFIVTIQDDSDIEADEDFIVQLSNVTGGAGLAAPASATVTIVDDDTPPPQPGDLQFSMANYEVDENGTSITIEVTRTGGSDGEVTADYTTLDDSATDGSDYDISSGTLTFADGVLNQSFTVVIIDDSDVEGEESFSLQLSNPGGGAALGTLTEATVTIIEDDEPPPEPGTLQFTVTDYTVLENVAEVTLEVSRTNGSDGAVTVDYESVDDSASGTDDFVQTSGTLSFADAEVSQTITINIQDDSELEGDEDFLVKLSNPTAGAALGSAVSSTVTITENDYWYFSTVGSGNGNSVSAVAGPYDDADIYGWNGAASERLFDAVSDLNLPVNADIDGLAVIDQDTFYLSFNRNAGTAVPTLAQVQDEDVVLYEAGNWSLFFDGSACELDADSGYDLDAIDVRDDTLYFSIDGNVALADFASGDDADIYRWDGDCNFSRIFDAADLPGYADIDGLAVSSETEFCVSLKRDGGTPLARGLALIQDEDIACFDGSNWSLLIDAADTAGLGGTSGQDVDAFDLP